MPGYVFHSRMTTDDRCLNTDSVALFLPQLPANYHLLTSSLYPQILLWHTYSCLSVNLEPYSLWGRVSGHLMSVVPEKWSPWVSRATLSRSSFPPVGDLPCFRLVLNALHRLFQLFFNTILIATDISIFIYGLLRFSFPKTCHILIYLIHIITLWIGTIITPIL